MIDFLNKTMAKNMGIALDSGEESNEESWVIKSDFAHGFWFLWFNFDIAFYIGI